MEPVDLTVNKSDDGSRRNCESPEDEGSNSMMMDHSTSDSDDSSPSSFSRSWNSLLWASCTSPSQSSPSTCIDLRVKKGKPMDNFIIPVIPSLCKKPFVLWSRFHAFVNVCLSLPAYHNHCGHNDLYFKHTQ